jgi:CheY-like chemotaxis protein
MVHQSTDLIMSQLRVLIAEDNEELRLTVGLLLPLAGMVVLMAVNGAEAVEEALANLPDLILMDLSMPEMDGWAAMERLLADPATASIPVLAMSAIPAPTEELRKAGFCGFLPKPFGSGQLVAAIRAVHEASSRGVRWVETLPSSPA